MGATKILMVKSWNIMRNRTFQMSPNVFYTMDRWNCPLLLLLIGPHGNQHICTHVRIHTIFLHYFGCRWYRWGDERDQRYRLRNCDNNFDSRFLTSNIFSKVERGFFLLMGKRKLFRWLRRLLQRKSFLFDLTRLAPWYIGIFELKTSPSRRDRTHTGFFRYCSTFGHTSRLTTSPPMSM